MPVLRSTKDIRDRISQGEPFFLFCDEKEPGEIQPVLRDVPALTPVLRMTNPYRPGETFWLFHWPADPKP